MRKILILSLFLIIFILGCSKEEAVSEPIITADVIESAEEFEDITKEVTNDAITVRLCHDTDNGIVRWVNGSIFGFYHNSSRFEFKDYCEDKNFLIEYHCEDENPLYRRFVCKNGCVDAHCV
jgi:hypothetical protein|tara:strand:- start:608 stop:973 length:366 start_codon:yes stop_codon:yes gene_type:complete